MRNRYLMRALPHVASALSDRYGVQVIVGGEKAFTNGSTIHLPALPEKGDADFLCLVRGFLDHEAAHIRYTDFQVLKNVTAQEMPLLNSLEDWRVEKNMAAAFPGCRQNFQRLARIMFGSKDVSSFSARYRMQNWILLKVRSWELSELNVQLETLEQAAPAAWNELRKRVEPVLERFRHDAGSTAKALQYTREILCLISSQKCVTGSPTGRANSDKKAGKSSTNTGIKGESFGKRVPGASFDEIGEVLSQRIAECDAPELPRFQVATCGSLHCEALPHFLRDEALRCAVPLRARLTGGLQASRLVRNRVGISGRLAPRLLARSATGSSRLFVREGQRCGLNTAVHILLDCSGSMRKRMHVAGPACYALAKALEQVGVNVGVTAFPARAESEDSECTVFPLVKHGERVHQRFWIKPVGDTPLGETLWWLYPKLQRVKEARKIVLVLTDGRASSEACAKAAIVEGERLGIELMGVSIQSPYLRGIFHERCENIDRLEDLAPALFRMLQGQLLKTQTMSRG